VSKSGRLPCKAIIHAVGPMWSTGRRNEKNLLYETVFNILEEAESQGFTSVAMPAISTGIYQFPLDLAATIILDAVKDFLKQPLPGQKLREVHVIDQSSSVASQFCKTALTVFKDVDNVKIEKNEDAAEKSSGRSLPQTSRSGE